MVRELKLSSLAGLVICPRRLKSPYSLCFGGQQQGDGAEVSCIAKYFTLKFDFEESSEEWEKPQPVQTCVLSAVLSPPRALMDAVLHHASPAKVQEAHCSIPQPAKNVLI